MKNKDIIIEKLAFLFDLIYDLDAMLISSNDVFTSWMKRYNELAPRAVTERIDWEATRDPLNNKVPKHIGNVRLVRELCATPRMSPSDAQEIIEEAKVLCKAEV